MQKTRIALAVVGGLVTVNVAAKGVIVIGSLIAVTGSASRLASGVAILATPAAKQTSKVLFQPFWHLPRDD